jgi:hypothetical protein
MNSARKVITILLMLVILSSCTVLNNLYVADPEPMGKKNSEFYLGVASGLRPVPDDVDDDGNISFSGDVTWAPNVAFGGQYGIGDQFNLRFAMHFASVFGGAGARGGAQYCPFSKESKFKAAIGTDLGFVAAWDSLKIWGDLDIHINGAWNADFFIPISYDIGDNTSLNLGLRYSFTTVYVRENKHYRGDWNHRRHFPVLSLGLRTKKVLFEVSALYLNNTIYPNFGIVFPLGNKGAGEQSDNSD